MAHRQHYSYNKFIIIACLCVGLACLGIIVKLYYSNIVKTQERTITEPVTTQETKKEEGQKVKILDVEEDVLPSALSASKQAYLEEVIDELIEITKKE